MNLFLHGIGGLDGEPTIERTDALIADTGRRFDYVLANPPFGKKSSMTITNEEGDEDRDALTYERQDFWETTSNKQLNFLQHIVTLLKADGKAAMVLPDNVLFFDARPRDGRVQTQGVWIYDLRTNRHFTLKTRPLKPDDLRDFIDCYRPDNRHERAESERFRYHAYADLVARDKASLDIFWLKDDALDNLDDLPAPDVLQKEIIDHLEAALAAFRDVAAGLPAFGAVRAPSADAD